MNLQELEAGEKVLTAAHATESLEKIGGTIQSADMLQGKASESLHQLGAALSSRVSPSLSV